MIPILENNDASKVIGHVQFGVMNRAFVTFVKGVNINRPMFFSIFNCGAKFIDVFESDGEMCISRAEILEFSLSR